VLTTHWKEQITKGGNFKRRGEVGGEAMAAQERQGCFWLDNQGRSSEKMVFGLGLEGRKVYFPFHKINIWLFSR
jgi:hypothetical protein